MLALVALLTALSGLLTQFLALLRRRSQLALLRVIGLTRGRLTPSSCSKARSLGVLGAALGVALGCAPRVARSRSASRDLGAGYFRASRPTLAIEWTSLATFFVLGVLFAVGGALLPALEAGRRSAALALKAGDEEEALSAAHRTWPGVLLVAAGLLVSQLPAPGTAYRGLLAVSLICRAIPRPHSQAGARVCLPRAYRPAALGAARFSDPPAPVG